MVEMGFSRLTEKGHRRGNNGLENEDYKVEARGQL
jgi:hypothetical protein